jgi:hypothetical protein
MYVQDATIETDVSMERYVVNVFLATQQLKQRRFYGRDTSNELEQLF